jgi:hypothetical protein
LPWLAKGGTATVSPPQSADAAMAAAAYFANRPAGGDFILRLRRRDYRISGWHGVHRSYFQDTPSDGRYLRARFSVILWVLVWRSYTLLVRC